MFYVVSSLYLYVFFIVFMQSWYLKQKLDSFCSHSHAEIYYNRKSFPVQWRTSAHSQKEMTGGEERMTCIVTVAAQPWFKVSEGLTSHLETFILFCISKYEGVCGRGPGVICATTLVVFQCLWDDAGYDQRYPSLTACMRTAFPF